MTFSHTKFLPWVSNVTLRLKTKLRAVLCQKPLQTPQITDFQQNITNKNIILMIMLDNPHQKSWKLTSNLIYNKLIFINFNEFICRFPLSPSKTLLLKPHFIAIFCLKPIVNKILSIALSNQHCFVGRMV